MFHRKALVCMRLRKTPPPLTPEEIRERNIQRNRERIFNPPKPSLWDRFMDQLFKVEEWWGRHVTQRRLYRALDGMRMVIDMRMADAGKDQCDPAVIREKLRADLTSYPEYYPWGDDGEQP